MSSGAGGVLILSKVVLACAALTAIAAVAGASDLVGLVATIGYLAAIAHAFVFVSRDSDRTEPAVLLGRSRLVLGLILGAMTAAAAANLVAVWIYLPPPQRDLGETSATVGLTLVIVLLCWRAWVRPSASRAGWLQLFTVLLGVPNLVSAGYGAHPERHAAVGVTMIALVVVVACAGAALDELFSRVRDREPATVPEAIVHDG